MRDHVGAQAAQHGEGFLAHLAHKGFLPGVGLLVVLERAGVRVPLVAHVAGKGARAAVRLLVLRERGLAGEGFVADVADKALVQGDGHGLRGRRVVLVLRSSGLRIDLDLAGGAADLVGLEAPAAGLLIDLALQQGHSSVQCGRLLNLGDRPPERRRGGEASPEE